MWNTKFTLEQSSHVDKLCCLCFARVKYRSRHNKIGFISPYFSGFFLEIGPTNFPKIDSKVLQNTTLKIFIVWNHGYIMKNGRLKSSLDAFLSFWSKLPIRLLLIETIGLSSALSGIVPNLIEPIWYFLAKLYRSFKKYFSEETLSTFHLR